MSCILPTYGGRKPIIVQHIGHIWGSETHMYFAHLPYMGAGADLGEDVVIDTLGKFYENNEITE